jgi:hypothetical protein
MFGLSRALIKFAACGFFGWNAETGKGTRLVIKGSRRRTRSNHLIVSLESDTHQPKVIDINLRVIL